MISADESLQILHPPKKVEQQFGYASLGLGPFPLPLPAFGIGYRTQKNHHGFDLSLQAATVVAATELKVAALYHYYWKPCLLSQSYVGIGAAPAVVLGGGCHLAAISPEFVMGKQYQNENGDRRFFQAEVSFPTFSLDRDDCFSLHHHKRKIHSFFFPLVVLSYGIGF